jgi:hypothetical protein
MTDELDAIAAELYALTPDEFTAARNARAAASGDLRTQVKALRKPTASAWAVGLLAREGALGEALELSAALHDAQDDLDAAELAKLSRQRRQLVAALAAQAAKLAEARGVAISGAARADVERTVDAAVRDAAAAAAVMTGRLVRPLSATGVEPVDLTDAVGGSIPGVAERAAPTRDDLAERRARKAAEQAAREAERAANEAGRELARVEARVDRARERADHLAERIDDLTRDLERVTAEAATADEELARWERERIDAAARAAAAEKRAEAARDALG